MARPRGGSALLVLARAPSPPPGPGPEQKRLARFAGIWEFRLEMKPGPFGPGGVVTGTDDDELLPGGFFLVRRYETKSPVGEIRGLEVIGYDAATGKYFQRGFDSFGATHVYTGTVEGDTWIWGYEASAGGREWRVRVTRKEISPSLDAYASDISADGRTWTTVLDGTRKKVK